MQRSAAALVVLALSLAPSTVRADSGLFAMLQIDDGDRTTGLMSLPAFGSGTTFMAFQAIETSRSHWFDRSWAVAELVTGIAASAYSSYLLYGAIEAERGQAIPISSFTAGAALGMNLRLIAHGVLSYALFDGGEDPLARALVPSISVSPREGGAFVALSWVL